MPEHLPIIDVWDNKGQCWVTEEYLRSVILSEDGFKKSIEIDRFRGKVFTNQLLRFSILKVPLNKYVLTQLVETDPLRFVVQKNGE